ncbi:hypothetical protein N7534_001039 [Penicillium rubens]|nr:hypothetical protein N7525_003623 [Penicillium rubens]KAJ5866486.1 hypothetical protein N7534_001039 [Penicillium rubens]
MQHTYKH